MGLVIKGSNIGIYKADIKNINSFKDLTLPPLFSKNNGLDLRPIFGFLPVFTTVKSF
jgi:hypothetical protein